MSDSDVLEMLGYLFVAWSTGWISGAILRSFNQAVEKL